MGRIHFERVSLDELMSLSPLVAVADVTPPGLETVSLPLGEGVEPYSYTLTHWAVKEWLRPARRAWQAERIVVSGFDTEHLSLHVAFHAYGIHRSPVWPSYTPLHPPVGDQGVILFLRRGAFLRYDPEQDVLDGRIDTLVPALMSVAEGAAARDTIAALAAQPCPRADRLELVIGAPGYDETMDARIGELVSAHFGHERSIAWRMVDTLPQRR